MDGLRQEQNVVHIEPSTRELRISETSGADHPPALAVEEGIVGKSGAGHWAGHHHPCQGSHNRHLTACSDKADAMSRSEKYRQVRRTKSFVPRSRTIANLIVLTTQRTLEKKYWQLAIATLSLLNLLAECWHALWSFEPLLRGDVRANEERSSIELMAVTRFKIGYT